MSLRCFFPEHILGIHLIAIVYIIKLASMPGADDAIPESAFIHLLVGLMRVPLVLRAIGGDDGDVVRATRTLGTGLLATALL